MEFLKLPKLVDVRSQLAKDGSYIDYGIESKTDIAIHHSLTKVGDAFAFARYHVSLGWMGVGYQFVILKDGTIQWCHDLGVKSYHVGNSNRFALGICLVGDFRSEEPTDEQKDSLFALHEALKKDLPNYKRTRGHNEFVGYEWKLCPVFDYKAVINRVEKVVEAPKTEVKSKVAVSVLGKGDKGQQVKSLQEKLVKLGYKLPKYGCDSDFGNETFEKLKQFQRDHGLKDDGLAGKLTFAEIEKQLGKLKNKPVAPYPNKLYKLANPMMHDENVRLIQEALNKHARKQVVKIDKWYGKNTAREVGIFQRKHGLSVDQIVGKNTWTKLIN
jgi:N-acetylmuramoyl-L-alanine amidase